jgi:histidinol dehydrogenase
VKILQWAALSEQEKKDALSRPSVSTGEGVTAAVRDIIATVRENGDAALFAYTEKFDGIALEALAVSSQEIEQAASSISAEAKAAIDQAYTNIRRFHEQQGFKTFTVEVMDGISCRREVRPYEAVGLYVPGGSAPLISTTLMIGIPSQIAGCKTRVMCTPCDKKGNINPHILYAATICGIDTIFKTGGAQAIAAMAYGAGSVPKVDKIFGPGNAYVTAAKSLVAANSEGAALDMPAGPSEVLVVADETTNPVFAAADLLSQAEHDAMSQVILLATNKKAAKDIYLEVEKQVTDLPRKDIAEKAIENSRIIIVSDIKQAIDVSNAYAPEHLVLCIDDAEQYCRDIQNAGSVFVGPYSCESAGDYASGTNHVLPTYGYARNYSGLSLEAFQKTVTFQSLSEKGLEGLGDTIEKLADLEGLEAHRRAVSCRRTDHG